MVTLSLLSCSFFFSLIVSSFTFTAAYAIHSKLDAPGARSCALSFPCIEHQQSPAHSVASSSTPAPIVPYADLLTLREATGYFSESNVIGRGGFGVVYEVCDVLLVFLLVLGSPINMFNNCFFLVNIVSKTY